MRAASMISSGIDLMAADNTTMAKPTWSQMRTTISHIENGRPGTVATLLNVLDSLGLDLLVAPRHSKDATVLRNRMASVLAETSHAVRVRRLSGD